MHHAIIGINPDRAAAEALMADRAMAVLAHDNAPVQAAGDAATRVIELGFTEADLGLDIDFLDAAQARHYAFFVHDGVGVADAA